MADELAAAGYIVLAPDLLSGFGPNGGGSSEFPSMDATTKAVSGLDPAVVTSDLNAVADYGKQLPAANGKLAVAGFCWGGGKSFAFATTRTDLSAAFVFYGPPPPAAAMATITRPRLRLLRRQRRPHLRHHPRHHRRHEGSREDLRPHHLRGAGAGYGLQFPALRRHGWASWMPSRKRRRISRNGFRQGRLRATDRAGGRHAPDHGGEDRRGEGGLPERRWATMSPPPTKLALLRALADLQYQTHEPRRRAGDLSAHRELFPDDSLEASELRDPDRLRNEEAHRRPGRAGARPRWRKNMGRSPAGAEAYLRARRILFLPAGLPGGAGRLPATDDRLSAERLRRTRRYFSPARPPSSTRTTRRRRRCCEKVPDNSPFKPDARLWEGKTFQRLLNFPQATALFDWFSPTEKSRPGLRAG